MGSEEPVNASEKGKGIGWRRRNHYLERADSEETRENAESLQCTSKCQYSRLINIE